MCFPITLLSLLRAFIRARGQEFTATLQVCGLQDRFMTDPPKNLHDSVP